MPNRSDLLSDQERVLSRTLSKLSEPLKPFEQEQRVSRSPTSSWVRSPGGLPRTSFHRPQPWGEGEYALVNAGAMVLVGSMRITPVSNGILIIQKDSTIEI